MYAVGPQRAFVLRAYAAFEAEAGDAQVARHYFARAVNAQVFFF